MTRTWPLITRKTGSMTQINKNEKPLEALSTEGIELFDEVTGHDPVETAIMPITDKDWTPEQAAKAIGKSIRTVRRMLQEGTLSGYKVPGKRRDEWRVKPVKVAQSNTVIIPGKAVSSVENDRLWDLVKQQAEKIEALSVRNGWLESQLQERDKEIKLLTDSQHKAKWWQRLVRWRA